MGFGEGFPVAGFGLGLFIGVSFNILVSSRQYQWSVIASNIRQSLVGIVYRTWITPIEDYPHLHNTRTGLGGFSDRVGALAYVLTPFTILLSNRESCLSLLTGIPYVRLLHKDCLKYDVSTNSRHSNTLTSYTAGPAASSSSNPSSTPSAGPS
jgi:hypothetical protein